MLLDLFCGGGGAGEGYRQAGFTVLGIDLHPRRCGYPAGEFVQADCREVLRDLRFLRRFAFIHASPPCQVFTRAQHLRTAQGKVTEKLDLVDETRQALLMSGVPFAIENVEGAPLRQDLLLCGSFFRELRLPDGSWLQRHRIFELGNGARVPWRQRCRHGDRRKVVGIERSKRPLGVYHKLNDAIPQGGRTAKTLADARTLMGIDWMSFDALAEAIPPAYTRYLGSAQVHQERQPLAVGLPGDVEPGSHRVAVEGDADGVGEADVLGLRWWRGLHVASGQ